MNLVCPQRPGGNFDPVQPTQWWLDQQAQGHVEFIWPRDWYGIIYDPKSENISISFHKMEIEVQKSGKIISLLDKEWGKYVTTVELRHLGGKEEVVKKKFDARQKYVFNLKKYPRGRYKVTVYFGDKITLSKIIEK